MGYLFIHFLIIGFLVIKFLITYMRFLFSCFSFFRIVANDIFKQDWRSQTRGGILQYIILKWTLACLVGLLTGITGFSINLAVENIAGFKLLKVDQFIQDNRWCLLSFIFIHHVFKHVSNGKYIYQNQELYARNNVHLDLSCISAYLNR